MMLTDLDIRGAKPRAKPFKLWDTGGLFLLVSPTGGKLWRFKYRVGGREKLLALGGYPDVTLKAARLSRDQARHDVARGIDPGQVRKNEKAARNEKTIRTFESVAREWLATCVWVERHRHRRVQLLERDFFPAIGDRAFSELTAADVRKAADAIQNRGSVATARLALAVYDQIARFARAKGIDAEEFGRLIKPGMKTYRPQNFAAPITRADTARVIRAIAAHDCGIVVKSALTLAPMLFVRPGELAAAEWKDVDFEDATWRFTTSKNDVPHAVPLATQAVAILRALKPVTGAGRWVFPGRNDSHKHMAPESILKTLRTAGIKRGEATVHGFRATAKTLLSERHHYPYEVIEPQLAHKTKDPNGTAYNRTTFIQERRKMMQHWADYLDELKAGADNVVPLRQPSAV